MIDIAISGLVKEFEVGKKILDGLTFQVDSGERVGLLGKNGCGKTTLLRILTGQLDWDEGEVVLPPDKRVGLISQIPVYPAGYTVEDVLDTAFRPLREMEEEMEQLAARMERGEDPALLRRYDQLTAAFEAGGGYDTDTRKNKVCSGLQIGPGMREQLFDRLSGGEKTRVNLGRLILEDTDILLLDEPTNHLDLKATEWLEEYLDKFKGTVLAVSHDRWFLDRVVDRVIEIQEGKAEFYSGNYSFYVVEKERRYQEKLKQYEKEQAKIQQLEKAAEQLRTRPLSGSNPWRSASSGCGPPTGPPGSGRWRSASGSGSSGGMRCSPSRGCPNPSASAPCSPGWTWRWWGASASPCWGTTAPANPPSSRS